MLPSHTSFIGLLIALSFSTSMGSLLWWMLHPPKPVSLAAAKVRVALDSIKLIVVPTVGGENAQRGIELACRLGLEQKAVIRLVNIIEVPLSLPLGAHLPGHEDQAQATLETGKQIVEAHNMVAETRVERGRHAAEKIAEMVMKENIELIVMGILPRPGGVENIIGRTTETLLSKLPCEIIIDAKPPGL